MKVFKVSGWICSVLLIFMLSACGGGTGGGTGTLSLGLTPAFDSSRLTKKGIFNNIKLIS
jgi:hypothetical protein